MSGVLGEFVHELVLALIAGGIAVGLGAAWRQLKRVPEVIVAGGVVLLAMGVLFAWGFTQSNFRTEGSPAGTIMFVVLGAGALGFPCVGLALLFAGINAGATGQKLANGVGLGLGAVCLMGGFHWLGERRSRTVDPYAVSNAPKRNPSDDDRAVVRRVPIGEEYALAWRAGENTPALALAIPAAQFVRADRIAVTDEGPRSVDLVVPEAGARLRIYRDVGLLGDGRYARLYSVKRRPVAEPAIWLRVRSTDGEWVAEGFECEPGARDMHPALERAGGVGCAEPGGWFARRMPSLFAAPREPVAVEGSASYCIMTFMRAGRPVEVTSAGACFDAPSLDAAAASIALIDQLRRDAASPPSVAERVERATRAAAACERMEEGIPTAFGRHESLRAPSFVDGRLLACRHAAALAAALPEEAAAQAGALLMRLLVAAPSSGADRDAAIARVIHGLEFAGRGESVEALHAHVMRLESGDRRLGTRERAASFAAVTTLAPRVIEPGDPWFDRARAAVVALRLHPTVDEPRRLAMLAGMEARAAVADPASPLAARVRFDLCAKRLESARDRETYPACARSLLEAWEARAAGAGSFREFGDEGELAHVVVRLLGHSASLSRAHATEAAAGLASARRLFDKRVRWRPNAAAIQEALDWADGVAGRPRAG